MNLRENFFLAMEALLANKVRSTLTMLGVIIGVLSVILLVALGTGARMYIEKQFSDMGTNILMITPGKAAGGGMRGMGATYRDLTYEDAKALERQAYLLKYVSPMGFGVVTAQAKEKSRDASVIGATPAFGEGRNLRAEIGVFLSQADVDAHRRVAVIGQNVWRDLYGGRSPLGETIRVNNASYRVIGILNKQGQSLGLNMDDIILIPLTSWQDLFNQTSLFQIIASAVSNDRLEEAEAQIRQILMRRHGNEEDFTIGSQAAMLEALDTILGMMTAVLAGIAAISLLVGGIGIMNILLVSVRERTREIGVRIAVGARKKDILAQFLIESVVISSVGGAIGIALGMGGALLFQLITGFPAGLTAWSIVLAFGFSFFVGVFFGVYPARKASRLDPIEALRYE